MSMSRVFRRLLAAGVSTLLLLSLVGVAPASACDQGCTPGYWKNHTDSWVTYHTNDRVDSVFTVPTALSTFGDDTLMDALRYRGGPGVDGAVQILLRAGVSSLLNSTALTGGHFFSTQMVVADINSVLATQDRQSMLDYAAFLDLNNNLGCPLN